jgi:quercetin dioxygenase-like cupin family protein
MAEEAKLLRIPNRFITDHNAEGKAVFNGSLQEPLVPTTMPNGDKFYLAYATARYPVDFDGDIKDYEAYLERAPGIVIPGGTVLRFVDIRPCGSSPMHRTVSLDYGTVVEGEIELVLDSGETRIMKRGDVSIQRGTMHLWRNTSKTEWARSMHLQEFFVAPLPAGFGSLGKRRLPRYCSLLLFSCFYA